MKVICDRAALLDAVNLISGVVPARSPKPQLSCVKMSAVKKGAAGLLSLAATDAEVSLRLTTPNVDIHQPGEALVPAQKLQQIVAAEEADQTLTLDVDKDVMSVKGADAEFKVFGYPPADFPPVPEFPADGEKGGPGVRCMFRITPSELESLISRTLFATARETSRYAINGVLLKLQGRKIEMVATDGRRLALARGAAEGGPTDSPTTCIIPTKALSLAAKLIDPSEEFVRVAITENQVIIAFGGEEANAPARAVLSSTLVEGQFPPYEDVIPRDQDKKAVFDVEALRSGVRRAALLTNEESRGVKMAFSSGKGKAEKRLRLSSRAPEMGEAEVRVDFESYDGEDIEIGFNPGFITDALKVVTDPQVVLELKAPNKPGLFKSGTDFLYVVMPVSLQ